MGGDHKCPVCEATFTRPQHVARHMRSHTGDRPYKCQYCGDQFARSDLLSRHVNKCHANEKPIPSAGVRKKGSASASRATTSKQVCDQCVQANTSCDGCNPCAKCVQRKFRCTFVKFHRQTAPVGPGHNNIRPETSSSAPPSPDSISSSRGVPMYHPQQQQQQQPEDDFILGPPPSAVVPTMAETLYGTTPFTFPPLYPTNDMGGDSTDYVKYRGHAELYGSDRSGMGSSSSLNNATTTTPTTAGLGSHLYDPRPWLSWGQQDATDAYQHHQQQQHHHPAPSPLPPSLPSMNDKDMDMQVELAHQHHHQQQQQQQRSYMNLSIPYPVPQSTSNYHLISDPNAANNNMNGTTTSSSSSSSSSHHHHHHHHDHRTTFQSKQVAFPTQDQNAFSSNQQHPHPLQQQIIQVADANLSRPEFSSAFGMLSLDDPNVMAGIATDGTPFFDDPNQAHNQPNRNTTTSGSTVDTDAVQLAGGDLNTPVPMKRGSGILSLEPQRFPMSTLTSSAAPPAGEIVSPPQRERDSKELKEFWKQYMRMPSSGSGILSSVSGGSEGVTPIGIGSKTANSSGPGPGYRRPRVTSMPTVKTLIMERDSFGYPMMIYPNQPLSTFNNTHVGDDEPAGARRLSQEMVGMGDDEDLRSYEAAVMARKAPTVLNLKVKRPMKGRGGGRGGGGGGGKPTDEASPSSGNSPHLPGGTAGGGGDTTLSHSSSSSSLANAFGRHSRDHTILSGGVPPFGRLSFMKNHRMDSVKKEESSSPSVSPPASSFSADLEPEGEDSMGPSDMELTGSNNNNNNHASRPSFKRLPSQTLGPDNQKRPFYGFEEEEEDSSVGEGSIAERRMKMRRRRRRRMSEPLSVVVGSFDREEQDRNESSRDVVLLSAVQSIDEG